MARAIKVYTNDKKSRRNHKGSPRFRFGSFSFLFCSFDSRGPSPMPASGKRRRRMRTAGDGSGQIASARQVIAKQKHSQRERRRVAKLSGLYQQLRSTIGVSSPNGKLVTKAVILEEALRLLLQQKREILLLRKQVEISRAVSSPILERWSAANFAEQVLTPPSKNSSLSGSPKQADQVSKVDDPSETQRYANHSNSVSSVSFVVQLLFFPLVKFCVPFAKLASWCRLQ